MSFQTSFYRYIEERELFSFNNKILLAVSGGVDSMVLLHLFENSEFNYGVVHCNFQLRGDDSDGDEKFVGAEVMKHGVEFYSTRFDTIDFARVNGISVEMAARELRYKYFEEIREKHGYDYIATAHHRDDLIETFFLNLVRKTGIRGLTGIKEKSGRIIRPLLFALQECIDTYAKEHSIAFREDRTNNQLIYQRNFIRHKIIPLFDELSPAFKKNMAETTDNLRSAEAVYSFAIDRWRSGVVEITKNGAVVNIEKLLESPFPKVMLFEILSEFNFNAANVEQLFVNLKGPPGRVFFSKKYRLIKDRDKLFITRKRDDERKLFYLEQNDVELFEPITLTVENIPAEEYVIDRSNVIASLDRDKLEFPLLIRKWRQGDYFQPLGMRGFKKLSDFFIDEKVPLHKKDRIWLLCSGQKIVWIIGYRIDDRFKVTPHTKRIAKITASDILFNG